MGLLAELPDAEVRAFLTAIRANPTDATARLVFADWLDERADPRAPLFRGDALPPGVDEGELLAEWSDVPSFDPFAGVGHSRGLLHVSVRACEYSRIDTDAYAQLYRAARQGWVTSFGFYGGSVGAILAQRLRFRQLVATADELDIMNESEDAQELTDDDLKGARRLGNLARLHYRGCALTDAALAHLRRHPRLEFVSLDGAFSAAGVRHLRTLPRLREAVLAGRRVDLGTEAEPGAAPDTAG